MMPAPMIGADRRARLLDVVERGERHLRRLRLRQQLDGDLGGDREQALAAVDERQQVVARAVERVAAELDDLAGDQHAAHAAHVVHGEPVLEAMHAAGVLGDVAADRAGDLRRRIRRVVEAVRRGGLRNREVAHAGLHDGRARQRVDRRRCCGTSPSRRRRRACPAARRRKGSCRRRARRPARAPHGSAAASRRPALRSRAARPPPAARGTA